MDGTRAVAPAPPGEHAARATRAIAAALQRSSQALLSQQAPEGFWCGELTADATLESDYILLQLLLHQPEDHAWNPPTSVRIQKAARAILERQLPDGGFNIYTGGPADVSATVKAYCALKLAGIGPDSDPLRRARERILALGGLQAANSYVKINLSLFGLYPARARALHPAGNRDAARQRALRNVLVDALHPGAALHRAGPRLEPPGARGVHARRTPAPRRQPRASQGEGPFGAVSPPRPRLQALGKARSRAHPQRRHPRGRALDSRPHAPHRRAWAPSIPP